jgi:hypothetical protein
VAVRFLVFVRVTLRSPRSPCPRLATVLRLPAPVLGQRTAYIVGFLDATRGIAANETLVTSRDDEFALSRLVFMMASSGFSLNFQPVRYFAGSGKTASGTWLKQRVLPNICCLGRLLDVMQTVGAVGEGAVELKM